ncbi:MAG: LytTR family DNA-binding domain-containing protein [bacterium]|nr:LytTR family DNA-binding domain-containing protein [bacterium]
MRVVIVEDDPESRELIAEYVDLHSQLTLIGAAGTGADAIKILKENSTDLVFLDIQLPDVSGVALARKLDASITKIFCTGKKDYALDAFEIGAVDYLIKPITQAKFNRAVDRVLKQQQQTVLPEARGEEPGLFLKGPGGVFTFVRFGHLIYLEARGKNSTAFTYPNSEIHTATMLKDIESRLPRPAFKRIHRQYVVNFSYVARIEHLTGGNYLLHLNDQENTALPMGRKYIENLRGLMR